MAAAVGQQPGSAAHGTHQDSFNPSIPSLFTLPPLIRDELETDSSHIQDETVDECLPFLTGRQLRQRNIHGVPRLDKERHVRFLRKQLGQLPSAFVGADPSRPWIFYWCLNALSLLGEDVEPYRAKLIETVRPIQNETGGFGGGFGQASHLATTYAVILSLALVGGGEAFEVVDRRSMWKWLSLLKQEDGGFQMAVGGEEDVRGAYCAAVVISLLNLPLDLSPDSPACAAGHTSLLSGLGEWVRLCQTYEGGVSAKHGVEAHGAYAFCALGCLSIIDSPHRSVKRYMDVPRLISWLSSRQYAPEGGFSGRTNKLVDGCYSHWVGGCWPLIEASLSGPEGPTAGPAGRPLEATDADDSLFSRNGLIRYSDAYHTCYVLSGLSSAQTKWRLVASRADETLLGDDRWEASPHTKGEQIFDEEDRVATTHPVYAIPQHRVDEIRSYFLSKEGF
ncbi:farnesyltransferase subunit beta [Trichoderma arundinaceum]|uniref:Protein farnesyltransferase subunit beta n=1 Tax=Trichoderma arundinaceum TaxID=490622 RepID=A0A395NTZ0_TRIAR|nr:farnesyltransferase subunit beta [Trichoderma arundinaceum]